MISKIRTLLVFLSIIISGTAGLFHIVSETAQAPPTFVSGIIYDGSGGPLNIAGSPYILVGSIEVPIGQTLTIEPGVQVKLDGFYNIYVYGSLVAIGTDINRILITTNKTTPTIPEWGRIEVKGNIEISYCEISYAVNGINLKTSSDNNITNNNIHSNNVHGIFLEGSSSNNNISGNTIWGNPQGIDLRWASNNLIADNNFSNNKYGIALDLAVNNSIIGNKFHHNGISIGGNMLSHFNTHTIPTDNSVNGQPIYYYKNDNGIEIDGIPVGELILANCKNFTINNTYLNDSSIGMIMAYSTNISITNNNISHNEIGIMSYESSNNNVTGNNISLNNYIGISFSRSSTNEIIGNNVSLNGYRGFYLWSSSNNTIYHNNIFGNSNQAIDDAGSNFWNSSYPIGGNYWGDFSPSCADNFNGAVTPQSVGSPDEICDNQYNIDSNSIDYYPLLNPMPDIKPPTIIDIRPPANSVTNDSMVAISADYYDFSGIDINSVVLEVDSINVTSSAIIASNGILYTPISPFADGIHVIKLKVKDYSSNRNTAEMIWNFTLDITPPSISGVTVSPSPQEVEGTVNISAAIIDNTSEVGQTFIELKDPLSSFLGNFSMEKSGDIYNNERVYSLPLGTYTFTIWANDTFNNWAFETGAFIIQDTTPPEIANLRPYDSSKTADNTPTIGANYSDISGINTTSVVLKVDNIDVTSATTITTTHLTYIPGIPLSNGIHDIYLEVNDSVGNHATLSWSFSIDKEPPNISSVRINGAQSQIYPFSAIPVLTLSAVIDDSFTGNSNITGANYTIGQALWPGSNMNALIPPFNNPIEEVSATIIKPTISGTFTYNIYAWDEFFNYNTTAPSATLIIKDDLPPRIHNVRANGANTITVSIGTLVQLSANIDDIETGSSGISGANYTIGFANWPGKPLNPTNPPLDNPIEDFSTTIDTTDWPIGSYFIYVYGWDNKSNYNITSIAYSKIRIIDTTPPFADAGNDIQIMQGNKASFDGSDSSDDSNTISNFTWNFGYDNGLVFLYKANPNFTFERIGAYKVTLCVRDPSNNTSCDVMWVNVEGIDSDDDGLTDYDEERIHHTDPYNPDTDGDGINDGDEVAAGQNPLIANSFDFLSDYWWIILSLILIAVLIALIILQKVRKRKSEEPQVDRPEQSNKEHNSMGKS